MGDTDASQYVAADKCENPDELWRCLYVYVNVQDFSESWLDKSGSFFSEDESEIFITSFGKETSHIILSPPA